LLERSLDTSTSFFSALAYRRSGARISRISIRFLRSLCAHRMNTVHVGRACFASCLCGHGGVVCRLGGASGWLGGGSESGTRVGTNGLGSRLGSFYIGELLAATVSLAFGFQAAVSGCFWQKK
jgi:hypothetical protein